MPLFITRGLYTKHWLLSVRHTLVCLTSQMEKERENIFGATLCDKVVNSLIFFSCLFFFYSFVPWFWSVSQKLYPHLHFTKAAWCFVYICRCLCGQWSNDIIISKFHCGIFAYESTSAEVIYCVVSQTFLNCHFLLPSVTLEMVPLCLINRSEIWEWNKV